MLARLSRDLPGDGYLYEPKWDGFRCLAFRSGREVDLRSRNQRPLARYFPEIVEALAALDAGNVVLDGELVASGRGGLDFTLLLARLHPAASRVERLRRESPASFIAFDLLAEGTEDLTSEPFSRRRSRLEEVMAGASAPLFLTPLTSDRRVAESWLEGFRGRGIEGVVAKAPGLRYRPGARSMVKVKRQRTADCVVAGYRTFADEPLVASLLLGLYEPNGVLRHIGVVAAFSEARRLELLEEMRPFVAPLEGHPWEGGFLLGGNPIGRLGGAATSWTPDRELDWTPLRPALVCEVGYDGFDGDRFRHAARFLRWRPDRDPRSCTFDQFERSPSLLAEILPLG